MTSLLEVHKWHCYWVVNVFISRLWNEAPRVVPRGQSFWMLCRRLGGGHRESGKGQAEPPQTIGHLAISFPKGNLSLTLPLWSRKCWAESVPSLCLDIYPTPSQARRWGCWCACFLGWGLLKGVGILAFKWSSVLGGPVHSQKVPCDFRPWSSCICPPWQHSQSEIQTCFFLRCFQMEGLSPYQYKDTWHGQIETLKVWDNQTAEKLG